MDDQTRDLMPNSLVPGLYFVDGLDMHPKRYKCEMKILTLNAFVKVY